MQTLWQDLRCGCDFLKIYSLLSREAFFALADEARQQQIPFVGHLPTVYASWRLALARWLQNYRRGGSGGRSSRQFESDCL